MPMSIFQLIANNIRLFFNVIISVILLFICNFYVSAADSSTINVTANIIDNACEVNSESKNIIVDFSTLSAKDFRVIGRASRSIAFNISIGNCGVKTTNVKVKFMGVADSLNTSLLSIGTGSSASGVAIEILDGDGVSIPINSYQNSYQQVNYQTTNYLHYYARLVSTKQDLIVGTINANATFVLEFE